MTTKIITLVAFSVLLVLVIYFKAIEFRWLSVDMGWCQKYGSGLRIFQKVLIEFPQSDPSACV